MLSVVGFAPGARSLAGGLCVTFDHVEWVPAGAVERCLDDQLLGNSGKRAKLPDVSLQSLASMSECGGCTAKLPYQNRLHCNL
jgi:hypothetical protein